MTALSIVLVAVGAVALSLRFPRTRAGLIAVAPAVVLLDVIAIQTDFQDGSLAILFGPIDERMLQFGLQCRRDESGKRHSQAV